MYPLNEKRNSLSLHLPYRTLHLLIKKCLKLLVKLLEIINRPLLQKRNRWRRKLLLILLIKYVSKVPFLNNMWNHIVRKRHHRTYVCPVNILCISPTKIRNNSGRTIPSHSFLKFVVMLNMGHIFVEVVFLKFLFSNFKSLFEEAFDGFVLFLAVLLLRLH